MAKRFIIMLNERQVDYLCHLLMRYSDKEAKAILAKLEGERDLVEKEDEEDEDDE